ESEEKDVAGEVAELEAPYIDAYGDELADQKRPGSDGDCTKKPPDVGWDRLGCAFRLRERCAGEFAPEAVGEGENQERLGEPERAIDELLVIPEPAEGGPETVALKCFDDGGSEWSEEETEGEERKTEAKETVAEEACVAFAFERERSEVTGEKEE